MDYKSILTELEISTENISSEVISTSEAIQEALKYLRRI